MPSVPAWSRADLKRPAALLVGVASVILATLASTVLACNLHEFAHAIVGTLLGWEVDRIVLCLPSGGRVVYGQVGAWIWNLQGYSGGLLAALSLLGAYYLVFARGEKPLRGPGWWGAGLGLALAIGPQVVVGVLEGAVAPGEDYTHRYRTALPILVAAAAGASAVLYIYRWRVVWREQASSPKERGLRP